LLGDYLLTDNALPMSFLRVVPIMSLIDSLFLLC
jgi:hypothetical protein